MKAIELSKQQALDADLKAILKINIIGNLDQAGYTAMLFITEESKEFFFWGGVGGGSQGTVRVLLNNLI